VAVARSHLLDVLNAALAVEKRREETGQLAQTFGLAARGQQRLAERKILDCPSQTEAETRIAGVGGRERLIRREAPPFVVACDGARAGVFLRRGGVIIVEVFDRAAQIGELVVDFEQLKTPPPDGQDIQPPVGVFAQDALHPGRAAGVHNAFFMSHHDAEFGLVAQRGTDHFLIAVFEDVQRELGGRQQDHAQGKQRQPAVHATIMTFREAHHWCAGGERRVILKLKQTPGIYLVGFMGCGKSTVGSALADQLGWSFFDLDQEIEKAADQSVTEIFERDGEGAFRAKESAALQKLVRGVRMGRPQVIAMGGGAFTMQDNFDLATNHGVTIWLDTPLEVIERRIAEETHRPLARDPARMRALYADRRAAYARADYRVETFDHDAGSIVARILELPLFRP
jgi:shikimate kinase